MAATLRRPLIVDATGNMLAIWTPDMIDGTYLGGTPSAAIAVGAITPVPLTGAGSRIWSTTTSSSLIWDGSKWTSLAGSSLSHGDYVDLASAQSIGGAKSFTSACAGTSLSLSGALTTTNVLANNGTVSTKYVYVTACYPSYSHGLYSITLGQNFSGVNREASIVCNYMTTPPTYVLQLYYSADNSSYTCSSAFLPSGAMVAVSDATMKENVKPVKYGLAEVLKFKPSSFTWKTASATEGMGFLAQEIQAIVPEAVHAMSKNKAKGKDKDDNDIDVDVGETLLGINHNALLPIMVRAMQEMHDKIVRLEAALQKP